MDTMQQPPAQGPRKINVSVAIAIILVVIAGGIGYAILRPTGAKADVLFQDPRDPGPNPFSNRTDLGAKQLDLTYPLFVNSTKDDGQPHPTPFGGSGSNRVCKPELMITYLEAHPDRLRVWAGVLHIQPSQVRTFIHGLAPVILKRDTRVTNHGFVNGQASSFQSILPAGTAVLVTKKGEIVARCRCGNPLTSPVVVTNAKCTGCPPSYHFPPPCDRSCFEYPCVGPTCFDIPPPCWHDPRTCVPPCPKSSTTCVPVCPPAQCPPPPCLEQRTAAAETTWRFLRAWTEVFSDVYQHGRLLDIADPCPHVHPNGTPDLILETPSPTGQVGLVEPTPTPVPTPVPTPMKTEQPTPVPTRGGKI